MPACVLRGASPGAWVTALRVILSSRFPQSFIQALLVRAHEIACTHSYRFHKILLGLGSPPRRLPIERFLRRQERSCRLCRHVDHADALLLTLLFLFWHEGGGRPAALQPLRRAARRDGRHHDDEPEQGAAGGQFLVAPAIFECKVGTNLTTLKP